MLEGLINLTEEDFSKIFDETLEKYCPPSAYNKLSRTLTKSESDKLKKHIWEIFEKYKSDFTQENLFNALYKTQNSGNMQDRAEAMYKQLMSKK